MIINMDIPSIYFKEKKCHRYTSRKMKDDNSIGSNYNVKVTCEKGVVIHTWKRIFICLMRMKILKNIVKKVFSGFLYWIFLKKRNMIKFE